MFAFDPATSSLQDVHAFTGVEGQDQGPALTLVDGKLWGMSVFGGVLGNGILFSVDPASGDLAILHTFAGAQIAGASGLTKQNGTLFGTAVGGGTNGLGSIYKVEPGRGIGQTLHSFQGSDGVYPMGPLTDVGGTLYGTTSLGGAPGFSGGTVFSYQPATRVLTTLAVFDDLALGGSPAGNLAVLDGSLYGTTAQGGSNFAGTIFKLDPATSKLTTVADFPFSQYHQTVSGLTVVGNLLYGTGGFGDFRSGIIFSFDPSTGTFSTLYSFQGGATGDHLAPLTYSNGLLYGSTPGNRRQPATIFSFDPTTSVLTVLHTLFGEPKIGAALTPRGNKLYDTFPSATKLAAPYGGIVRVNPADGNTMVTTLSAGPVANPASSFTLSNDALFGTTFTSTTDNAGVVFKYVP